MKKRFLPLLLSLALCLGLTIPTTLAAGDFEITDGVLTKYTGPGGDVVIPDGVTSIGKNAFSGKSRPIVILTDGETSIEDYAFDSYPGLTSVTIPDSVTRIENFAFQCCTSLTSVTIPDSVTSIGSGAFYGCTSLTSVTIPDSLTSIEGNTFYGCTSLTSVTIPNSVTSIGSGAFYGCTSLTSVTIPDSVTSIEKYAFHSCTSLTSVTIPVIIIESYAFYGCTSLTSVTIPDSVIRIGSRAYDYTSLTDVTIPSSVTFIGGNAFIENTTIYGTEGSYAQTWAAKYGYTFKTTSVHLAYASTQPVLVDGSPVELQAYALKDESGKPTNYVKLRDVAFILNGTPAQFDVGWDGAVNMETGKAYVPNGSEMTTPYSGDRAYETAGAETRINGSPAALEAIVLTDDRGGAYTYYKLRDLGQALGFNVGWSKTEGIFIETDKPYDPNN